MTANSVIRLRDVPEIRAFLERMYSDEVRVKGGELEGMPVSTQALLLGFAQGMEMRIEELERSSKAVRS